MTSAEAMLLVGNKAVRDRARFERDTADANRRAILSAQLLERWRVEMDRMRQLQWQQRSAMCHVSVDVLQRRVRSIAERRAVA